MLAQLKHFLLFSKSPIMVWRNPSTKKNKKNNKIILCFKKFSYI